MSAVAPAVPVGELLRGWRRRRHRSQLDLATEAEVSTRHLSFVETGRSKPSRELLLHLAEHLEVPLRERNALLLAAGYAPVHRETALDDAAMGPVRAALDRLLEAHAPFPALIVNRRHELVLANAPAAAFLEGIAPHLLAPPINVLRVSLHPDGMAPRIANLAEWGSHLRSQLHREVVQTADPALAALEAELAGYPGTGEVDAAATHDPVAALVVPLRLRTPDGGLLSFFSTIATFGTAVDITLAELSIESFFPADDATAAALGARPVRG